ncbi:BMC domain-containing protein [Acetobacterium carbinolicum]|jgi:microcompartment protein CcmL/EutN|uniref:BMC domain-containing protein n=1 Tax=Acetobacterium TaxID=33951 RepID=UPI002ACAB95B|nr:BMC domain-containing protein [Acetobacterium sp. K1/6]MDZ5725907.1 BMC domain-containing protein [Acetobacterium sp. K1/6]
MDIEIIKSPSDGVIKMMRSRLFSKDFLESEKFDTVGLVQGKLVEMFVATDIAEKTAAVDVVEIKGICPQHFTMIAVLGDIASVKEALNNIAKEFKERVSQ